MTSGFLNPLIVQELPETWGDTYWMLVAPLRYYSALLGGTVEIPISFITNFVSFLPLKNVGQRASVLHDFLTACSDVPNHLAAEVFHEALDSIGVNELLADAMYKAVALVGASHHTNDYKLADHLEAAA